MQLWDFFLLILAFNAILADNLTDVLAATNQSHISYGQWYRYRYSNQSNYRHDWSYNDDEDLSADEASETTTQSAPLCPNGLTAVGVINDCTDWENICYVKALFDPRFKCEHFDYYQVSDDSIPTGGMRYILRQNPDYGYLEVAEAGSLFRHLFTQIVDLIPLGGRCVLERIVFETEQTCSVTHTRHYATCYSGIIDAVCFYDGSMYNFCDNFLKICNSDCDCVNYKNDFLCETREGCSPNCVECTKKFELYPPPRVTLLRRGAFIHVIVKNALKIAEKNGAELHCFSENKNINYEMVWEKHNISKRLGNGDTDIYRIEFNHGGLFWCEYFTYPDMSLLKSDEAVFRHEGMLSFILNVTVNLKADHIRYAPYNVVTLTANYLREYLSFLASLDIFIVRVYPVQYDTFTNLTCRLNTDLSTVEDVATLQCTIQTALAEMLDHVQFHFTSFSLSSADRCLATTDESTNISFPTTELGRVATSNIPILDEDGLPVRRRCLGSYVSGSFWDDFDIITGFGQPSSITADLDSLLTSDISAEELNENLLNVIEGVREVIPQDVNLISQILSRIVSSNESFDLMVFTKVINEVMRFPKHILSKAQRALNSTDTILYNYDLMLGAIANRRTVQSRNDYRPTIIQSDLILAQVANIDLGTINGIAVYKKANSFFIESLRNITSFDQINFNGLVFATYLPKNLLDSLRKEYDYEIDMHLVTVLYLNEALFDPNNSEWNTFYVVSLFVPNFDSFVLDGVIPMYFNLQGSSPTCAFWRYGFDEQSVPIFGSWKYQNESLDQKTHKICKFEHMTHFALLVNAPSSRELHLLNRVTSAASMIGTGLIILTAAVFTKWREQPGTIVLLNYTAAVTIQHVLLFLCDIQADIGSVFCKIIGISIHYIMLVQFFWILVISYMQYLKLVVVFGQRPTNIVLKSCLISWFFPIIPVLIVICVAIEDYRCFITGYPFYFGLLLPMSVVIAINLVIFGRILHSLFCTGVKVPIKSNEYHKVSVSIILFFIMGFTWIFGLMAHFLDSMVFSYIFCILTGSHGLILCVYFVLLQNHTRRMWLERMRKCFGEKYSKGSAFSSTQTS